MIDVVVRMLDENGRRSCHRYSCRRERNDLMRAIDRWVINAVPRSPPNMVRALFVRPPRLACRCHAAGSIGERLRAVKLEPRRLVFQIREESVGQQRRTVALQDALHNSVAASRSRAGVGYDSGQLLRHLSRIREDQRRAAAGSGGRPEKQRRVKAFELAHARKAITIGERVQTPTMAVLWQPASSSSSYFVNAPE